MYYEPQDWVTRINERFCWIHDEKDVLERKWLEDPKRAHEFELAQPIDLVIVGAGAGMFCGMEECSREHPLGHSFGDVKRVTEMLGGQRKIVLLYAECCGTYPSGYVQFLRETIPHITWLTPEMDDLCKNKLMSLEGVLFLMEAGILKPAIR